MKHEIYIELLKQNGYDEVSNDDLKELFSSFKWNSDDSVKLFKIISDSETIIMEVKKDAVLRYDITIFNSDSLLIISESHTRDFSHELDKLQIVSMLGN